jgi:plasmid stabilization system protein ParE
VKPYAFHPAAAAEYTEAAEYHARVDPELARCLYEDIEGVICRIRQQPERFRRISPLARRALCDRFPYAVVYIDQPDRIWILAIMHGSRLPGYWRSRLV